MAIKEEEELKKILKKMDKRPFALSSVPHYGKDRFGREYGGFIKESTYNKMKYKPTNRGKKINKKGPYEI